MKGIGIQLVDHNDDGDVLDLKIDVKRDMQSGRIISGLVIGNTVPQNVGLILIAQPGEFKTNPTLGVGLADISLSSDYLEFRHRIRDQFPIDGLKVTKLDLYPNKPVAIEGVYE